MLGILLPAWLVYLSSALLLLALVGIAALVQQLRQYRDRLELEEAKSQRLLSQFSTPAWHPDLQEQPQEAPALDEEVLAQVRAEKREVIEKYERLRATYIKLYDRHKALVKQYEQMTERRGLAQRKTPATATPRNGTVLNGTSVASPSLNGTSLNGRPALERAVVTAPHDGS